MKKLKLALAALALIMVLPLQDLRCPVHNFIIYPTGKTKMVNQTTFYEYSCRAGDKYWVKK